jgi:hypothetical protein
MSTAPKSIGPWIFACVVVIVIAALVMTGHEAFVIQALGVCTAIAVFIFLLTML